MEEIPSVSFQDVSGGMMSFPADSFIPSNIAKKSINFHYDEIGQAVQRNGTTKLGSTVNSGQTCTGLSQFINSAGTLNPLVAVFNKTTYHYDESSWTTTGSGALTTTAKVRFASLIDLMFRVGGGSATKSWNGSGNWGSAQLTGAPDGKFIISYKSRIYIAGNTSFPDRLYRSSVVDVDGNITWDISTEYVDVNPQDADNITGLAKVGNLMLILKNRAIYRWNGSSTDPEIIIDAGTPSQESIARVGGRIFYFNPEGFFATDGGYPNEISRPLFDWIKAVPPPFYTSTSAFADRDHYYCNLGPITKDGRDYNNVWYVFTLSSQTQYLFNLEDSFRFMTKYVNLDETVNYVGGDTDGDVQTLFSGNTDNETAIEYTHLLPKRSLGGRSHMKHIQEVVAYVENGAGAKFSIIDDDGRPHELGQIRGSETVLDTREVRAKRPQFLLTGKNKGTPIVYQGFELIKVHTQGNALKENA